MKKLVLLIVTLLLVLVISVSAEGIDLSVFTIEELYKLKLDLCEELSNRGENLDNCFYPGEYIVGDEIPSGRYVFKCIDLFENENQGYLVLRADPNNKNSTIDIQDMRVGETYSMKLDNGNLLKIDRIIVIVEPK